MLGVHFAITAEQERELTAADEPSELLEDLEESWDDDDLKVDTDKAWDAIHRCLSDGTLDPDGGDYPLNRAVLGGEHLDEESYLVLLTRAEVRDVASALQPLTREWLRERYDALDGDYGTTGDQDFEYTWSNFEDVRSFYDRAATAGRAVLFTAT
ncbi:YfbM family protein [Actinoplanes sp. HUAS TT8]|uniref:YfbM family protein n=1 Tax=Actinoplanes sp. HUAS TT8 TaxID=3447453 RepID=UPI003F527116